MAPPFTARRRAVRLDLGAIEQEIGRRPARIGERPEDIMPDASGSPADIAIVKGLARAADGGRVNPASAGLQHMDDTADDASVTAPGHAPRLVGEPRTQPSELILGKP